MNLTIAKTLRRKAEPTKLKDFSEFNFDNCKFCLWFSWRSSRLGGFLK